MIGVKKAAICFTQSGKEVIERLNRAASEAGIRGADAYIKKETGGYAAEADMAVGGPDTEQGGSTASAGGEDAAVGGPDAFSEVTGSVGQWAEDRFREGAALLFVGAAGIAVRAIAGCVRDKLTDSPVIVIDDRGQFVIPLLSGHAGGANQMAAVIAELLGAVPVITTSTDIHGVFSADVFARENRLTIRNREGIRKVSAKAIEGKPVTLSVKHYPPKMPVDLIIADETDREYSLLLSPKPYTLGVGMKKNTDAGIAEAYLTGVLARNGIRPDEIYAVCTIDVKEEEPALRAFCDRHRLPLITFDAELLAKAEGKFSSSEFVKRTVGVDNVCERAAVLGAGPSSQLIVRKCASSGITAAIAGRRDGGTCTLFRQ